MWIWTSSREKSLVTESLVVNASPLIYLAHADLFSLLRSAGSPIRIPSAVRAEIQRRGSGDPTVRAIEAASWLEQVEPRLPESEDRLMHNEFTAITERDGDWFIAYSPEIPGANGQGRSKRECLESLAAAISLILEDRRQDGGPSPY